MLFAQANKVHQLVLCVRRVGVVHGRPAVAQAPFRPEQRFPGQAHKGFGDIQHPFAGKEVVIDITRFRLPATVGGVVVINFVAQIQPAAAQVVVEQAVTHVIAAGKGKRDVFVQRVGAGRVVAHGVEVAHLEALTVALQVARFLTQAVKTLVLATAQVVCHPVAVSVQQIGAGRTVIDQRLPLTSVIAIMPLQPQRLMNGHTQLFGSNCQPLILLA